MRWLREPPTPPPSESTWSESPTERAHSVDSQGGRIVPTEEQEEEGEPSYVNEPLFQPPEKVVFKQPVVSLGSQANAMRPRQGKWTGRPARIGQDPDSAPPPSAPSRPVPGGMLAPRFPPVQTRLPPLPAAPKMEAEPEPEPAADEAAAEAAAAAAAAAEAAEAAELEEAARLIQAQLRGHNARRGVAEVALQHRMVHAAKAKLLTPGVSYPHVPLMPIHPSVNVTTTPGDASCYERGRDAVLRFFIRQNRFFINLAYFLLFIFTLDVLNLAIVRREASRTVTRRRGSNREPPHDATTAAAATAPRRSTARPVTILIASCHTSLFPTRPGRWPSPSLRLSPPDPLTS